MTDPPSIRRPGTVRGRPQPAPADAATHKTKITTTEVSTVSADCQQIGPVNPCGEGIYRKV
jgi:hypothetical protein